MRVDCILTNPQLLLRLTRSWCGGGGSWGQLVGIGGSSSSSPSSSSPFRMERTEAVLTVCPAIPEEDLRPLPGPSFTKNSCSSASSLQSRLMTYESPVVEM